MTTHRAPDVLTMPRLRAERFTPAHVAELAILDADPAVQALVFGHTYTPDETRERVQRRVQHWDAHGFGDWVVRTAGGDFAGCVGLFYVPDRPGGDVHLGYALRPALWGRGYATEMARGALDAAFRIMELPVVAATTVRDHPASQHVLAKVGFVPMGADPNDPAVVYFRLERDAWLAAHAAGDGA